MRGEREPGNTTTKDKAVVGGEFSEFFSWRAIFFEFCVDSGLPEWTLDSRGVRGIWTLDG